MGFEGTRAPEDNQDNGNIDKRSDVYSFTSLLYRFLTGEYLDSNHHQGNPKAFDSHNKRKIKEKAPKGFQKFLIKGSRYNPSERYQDAVEMTSALEKVIDDLGIAKQTRKAKPWIFTILGLAGMASLIYAHVSTYEPKKLEMPVMYERNGSPGLLFLNQRDKTELTFDSETNPDLPRIAPVKGMMTAGIDRLSKLSTDNRNVAYLVKAMAYAFWTGRSVQDSPTTDSQEDLYRRYVTPEDAKRNEAICGPVYPVVAKSIEYALTKSQRQDGKIDLEDTIAIARLGAETVKLAKGLSNSQDFRQYANAKLKDGSYLIPKREREFIGLAIYYAKHDVDLMDKQEDLPY
jgi:serine/threonine protein kinase